MGTVAAAVGDLVIVKLESNPTTGFSWAAEPELKSKVLALKSQDFIAHFSAKACIQS